VALVSTKDVLMKLRKQSDKELRAWVKRNAYDDLTGWSDEYLSELIHALVDALRNGNVEPIKAIKAAGTEVLNHPKSPGD
jgi:hypothetical protein